MKAVRIVIFAKAALPGFAKTRLLPALGAQGAADIARRLLADALMRALTARVGPVELSAFRAMGKKVIDETSAALIVLVLVDFQMMDT